MVWCLELIHLQKFLYTIFFQDTAKRVVGDTFFLYFIVGEFPFSLKILLFSFILNYWIAIPMQPLNSVEFTLFQITALEYCNEVRPKNIIATVSNIVFLFHYDFVNTILSNGGDILY